MKDFYAQQRWLMVESQIRARGIRDARVLHALETVPRHLFIGADYQEEAYSDHPVPIGDQQTISQPYIVALMTELLELNGSEKVLELGTGSGYQAAILAEVARRVCTIERLESLSHQADALLKSLGYTTIVTRVGDGTCGWAEEAPFDAILVTAGAPSIPLVLVEQLAIGGRLVIPVGDRTAQNLIRITRLSADVNDVRQEDFGGCRFVSLIGAHGW